MDLYRSRTPRLFLSFTETENARIVGCFAGRGCVRTKSEMQDPGSTGASQILASRLSRRQDGERVLGRSPADFRQVDYVPKTKKLKYTI